jgi:hypothetical protein
VEPLLVIVNVDEQLGLQGALEKEPVAPEGRPEIEKVTD